MTLNSKYLEYIKRYLPSEKIEEGIKLLEQGVAPQYIVGNVDFYGYLFEVNNHVLIPRFETELLVEKTIAYIGQLFSSVSLKGLEILDIGTGSGCIAVTLKRELLCRVIGIDISVEALEVAKNNALCNQVEVEFIESDLFSNVVGTFDVIVSNPPYIREDEEIEDIVKDNEPHIALYAKEEGLYFYKKILQEASTYLKDKFLIALEIGCEQGEYIRDMAYAYLQDIDVRIEQDYSGKDRFVFIMRK